MAIPKHNYYYLCYHILDLLQLPSGQLPHVESTEAIQMGRDNWSQLPRNCIPVLPGQMPELKIEDLWYWEIPKATITHRY